MSRPGAMQIRHPVPWAQSIVSRACHRISHDLIHMLHIELTRHELIRLAGLGASGILGANMSAFAIESGGPGCSRFPGSANDRAVDDKAARRRLARLRSRARLAFGIHSKFGSTSALLGIALGASLGQAWRQLRRWIARSRQRHALADLDDRLLRDIGVIRERDIGVSREELRREIELFRRT